MPESRDARAPLPVGLPRGPCRPAARLIRPRLGPPRPLPPRRFRAGRGGDKRGRGGAGRVEGGKRPAVSLWRREGGPRSRPREPLGAEGAEAAEAGRDGMGCGAEESVGFSGSKVPGYLCQPKVERRRGGLNRFPCVSGLRRKDS